MEKPCEIILKLDNTPASDLEGLCTSIPFPLHQASIRFQKPYLILAMLILPLPQIRQLSQEVFKTLSNKLS